MNRLQELQAAVDAGHVARIKQIQVYLMLLASHHPTSCGISYFICGRCLSSQTGEFGGKDTVVHESQPERHCVRNIVCNVSELMIVSPLIIAFAQLSLFSSDGVIIAYAKSSKKYHPLPVVSSMLCRNSLWMRIANILEIRRERAWAR